MSLYDVPAKPPPLDSKGEPLACPRCGGIFERAVRLPDGTEIPGHPVGHPALCVAKQQGPPTAAQRDARTRRKR
jgi:hypothetical protein